MSPVAPAVIPLTRRRQLLHKVIPTKHSQKPAPFQKGYMARQSLPTVVSSPMVPPRNGQIKTICSFIFPHKPFREFRPRWPNRWAYQPPTFEFTRTTLVAALAASFLRTGGTLLLPSSRKRLEDGPSVSCSSAMRN